MLRPRFCAVVRPQVLRLERRAVPALILVTSAADSGPGSLRDSVALANANGQDDTIEFQFAVPTTIDLLSRITVMQDGSGKSLELARGASSAQVTLDGGKATELLAVDSAFSGPDFKLSGLSLTQGYTTKAGAAVAVFSQATKTTLTNVTITDCYSTGYRGAVFVWGPANLSGCTISNNTIDNTSGSSVSGGGIGTLGACVITNSIFSNNSAITSAAYSYGANISADALTITNSTISGGNGGNRCYGVGIHCDSLTATDTSVIGNIGGLDGAGIYTRGNVVALDRCQVNGNKGVGNGGGIALDWTSGVTVTVNDCTFDGNSAGLSGGAVWRRTNFYSVTDAITFNRDTFSNNQSGGAGGAFATSTYGACTVAFINCTLTGNSAVAAGGAISLYGFGGTANIYHSTVVENVSAHAGGGVSCGGQDQPVNS